MSDITVSIITASCNSIRTISDTVNSVLAQTHPNIEYIIIDCSSTDGTIDLVKSFGNRISKFVSEPDNGIYDAINKGIRLSSGSIVGILNSDDIFYNDYIIEKIVEEFNGNDIEAVFGDAQFVHPVKTSKIIRYYSSKSFSSVRFKYGYMPAHPTFYVKKELFDKLGYYKTNYKIAADFELLVRFLHGYPLKYRYLEMPFVSMRMGGVSNRSVWSKFVINKEIARACRENGIRTNYFFIYSKYLLKMFEFIGNRKESKSNAIL